MCGYGTVRTSSRLVVTLGIESRDYKNSANRQGPVDSAKVFI